MGGCIVKKGWIDNIEEDISTISEMALEEVRRLTQDKEELRGFVRQSTRVI